MNHLSALTRPRDRGFSLIELIVTLIIFGVLLTVATPSLVSLIRDSRLATHADLLVSSLNTARLEAVKQRQNFTVCAAIAPNTATACSGNHLDWVSGWIVIDAAGVVVQRIQAKTGISIDASLMDGQTKTDISSVVFRGTLGSSTAAATTTFLLCSPGRKQQQADVFLSGHISKQIQADCT